MRNDATRCAGAGLTARWGIKQLRLQVSRGAHLADYANNEDPLCRECCGEVQPPFAAK